MGVDEEILKALGDEYDDDIPATGKARQQARKPRNKPSNKSSAFFDSDESDYDPSRQHKATKDFADSDDDDESLEGWAEVQQWGPDLIGDAQDRARLAAMSELDREVILEERRKKVEDEKARKELQRRINATKRGNQKQPVVMKERKRQRVEEEEEHEVKSSVNLVSDLAMALTMQVKRSDLETWAHASFLKDTVVGCFVRVGVGSDALTKQPIYRVCQVTDVVEDHAPYKFGNTITKATLHVSHGRHKKVFRMHFASNSPIQESEWKRYTITMNGEKQKMVSIPVCKRKAADLQKARAHIFTNVEINEMIERKKQLAGGPANATSERVRLEAELEAAKLDGDMHLIATLGAKVEKLKRIAEQQASEEQKRAELVERLNSKNRVANISESRKAEIEAMKQKKTKGESDYDPFARRKTAPKHVVMEAVEDEPQKPKKQTLSVPATGKPTPSPTIPPTTFNPALLSTPQALKLMRSPKPSPKVVALDVLDDHFLESVDLSALEAGTLYIIVELKRKSNLFISKMDKQHQQKICRFRILLVQTYFCYRRKQSQFFQQTSFQPALVEQQVLRQH